MGETQPTMSTLSLEIRHLKDGVTGLDGRIAGLEGGSRVLAQQMAIYDATVRRSMAEQEAINKRLMDMLDRHDVRLRELETWRAAMQTKVPESLMSAAEIQARFRENEQESHQVRMTIARWAGIFVAASVLLSVAIQIAMPFLQRVLAGG